MRIVENMQDLITNINTLNRYLDDPDMSDYPKGLIKRGICFLAVNQEGFYKFYPSRFIGYKNNSQVSHDSNKKKDGRVTNPAISAIVGYPPRVSEDLERGIKNTVKDWGSMPLKGGPMEYSGSSGSCRDASYIDVIKHSKAKKPMLFYQTLEGQTD